MTYTVTKKRQSLQSCLPPYPQPKHFSPFGRQEMETNTLFLLGPHGAAAATTYSLRDDKGKQEATAPRGGICLHRKGNGKTWRCETQIGGHPGMEAAIHIGCSLLSLGNIPLLESVLLRCVLHC